MPDTGRTKVAVIGGGCAGVTAAFELTATQELRDRFEVTLYTLGWRLGGKGASGRNRDHAFRIEEHGLHVWFGFYDHSFDLMERAYAEMETPPDPPVPPLFDTVDDAFHECDNILLWHECPRGRWEPMRARLPPLPDLPGGISWRMLLVGLKVIDEQATPLILEHQELAAEAGLLDPHPLAAQASAALTDLRERNPEVSKLEHVDRLGERTEQTWQLLHQTLALAEARASIEGLAVPELEHERLAASLLGELIAPWRKFVDRVKEVVRDAGCTAQLVFMGLEFVWALWRGIVEDVLVTRSWDALDDYELTKWLCDRHGMSGQTARNAPWLRGFYDLVFGFEGGDWTKPNLAAGAAVKSWLQIAFNSKGTVMWKMNAGMGDVVFSPLYRVLRQRGVEVRFFQRVRRLELSAAGDRVERILVQPQARLAPGVAEYDPFVAEIADWPCWPSAPDWAQLEGGDDLKHALGVARTNLEDEDWDSGEPLQTLVRGPDGDFDLVVLAVSVASLKNLCRDLYDRGGKFAAMIDNSATVATQACQLWFKKPLRTPGLGWGYGDDPISSAYVEPLDTHSDMSHLMPREKWAGAVGSIAYFCGPLPDSDSATRHAAHAAAAAHAQAHLTRLEPFFPTAFAGGAFDKGELTAPGAYAGSDPFLEQYHRANSVGSERYVRTPAGSVKHRLQPHQSGCPNLFLAGDWTRTGIDGGCVEAAVISGQAAANAVAGLPVPAISATDPFPPVPPP